MKITKELLEEIGFKPYEIDNGFIYKLFYVDVYFDKNYNFNFYSDKGYNPSIYENDFYKLMNFLSKTAYESGKRHLKDKIKSAMIDL